MAKFKQSSADYLIAIGGGSPTDSSKVIGIIINNPELTCFPLKALPAEEILEIYKTVF